MKNAALTRFFSIVLLVMSLVLVATGGLGIKKDFDDNDKNYRAYEKLVDKTDTYETYSEKIKNSPSYADALEKYEAAEEEYNKAAAEHKTDLAIYTATQGGIREGREQIYAGRKQAYDQIEEKRESAVAQAKQAAEAGIAQAEANIDATKSGLDQLEAAVSRAQSVVDQAQAAYDAIPNDDEYAEQKAAAQAALESAKGALKTCSDQYKQTNELYQQMLYAVNNPEAVIKSAEDQANAAIDDARKMVDEKLQPAFDAIWRYEKDLEEDKAELDEEKAELDKQQKALAKQKEELDELKSDEQKVTSSKVTLMNNANIKASVDGGEELVPAARAEIARYGNWLNFDFQHRLIACILMLCAAFFGIIDIFPAFEKWKSRFLLIAPVVLFILCCAGAEAIALYLGRGHMYSALVGGILGIIHLIIALPRQKTIAEIEIAQP